jgi:putative transposase
MTNTLPPIGSAKGGRLFHRQGRLKQGSQPRKGQSRRIRTFGSRRVWHDVLAEGLDAGLHRIERLMRQEGLRARPRRRGLPKDPGQRHVASPNLLDRTFEASAPNQKWIADFTCIWTAQGWLFVAAFVDLFSRRVVG